MSAPTLPEHFCRRAVLPQKVPAVHTLPAYGNAVLVSQLAYLIYQPGEEAWYSLKTCNLHLGGPFARTDSELAITGIRVC